MNNIRNENCNIILREKASEKTTNHKHLINDLLNENFMRDNQLILNNHFGETKKNFRTSMDGLPSKSTKCSSKGFFNGTNNLQKMNKTLQKNQQNRGKGN